MLNWHKFDVNDIEEAIDEISLTAAAGPDGFPVTLLKTWKGILCKPLNMLWCKTLDLGIAPDLLNRNHIIPLHKGGSYANVCKLSTCSFNLSHNKAIWKNYSQEPCQLHGKKQLLIPINMAFVLANHVSASY